MQEVKIENSMEERTKTKYYSPKERKQNKLNTVEHCIQEIYHNARLVMIEIEVLHPYCIDKGFSNLLKRQYEEYTILTKKLIDYSKKNSIELRANASLSKFLMSVSTALTMITDKSNAHLAQIMIQGINIGVINIAKIQNLLSEKASSNEYADRLMMLFDQNLEDMKLFL